MYFSQALSVLHFKAMEARKPNPKLADVARAAGVSLATASRALSDRAIVRAPTRERVRNAALMLGYVPHGAARALATRRSRTIGAVFPPIDNPIFAAATQAIARELGRSGYTLLLATHEYDPRAELAVTRALIERGVDGLVLVGTDHDPELQRMVAQAGVPCELTWSIDQTGYHHCVGISHRRASIRMTQHLLDLGHREFAVIAGLTAHNDRARERLAGVRDALAARGLDLPDERVIEADFNVPQGARACNELLDRAPGFTALVCGNDIQAVGALNACARRGVRVPQVLSIAGFDDIDMAAEVTPALTTLRLPVADIGRIAAERLLRRLSGTSVSRVAEVPYEVVVRKSTGPVPT